MNNPVVRTYPTHVLVRELGERGFLVRWEPGAAKDLGRLVLEGPEQKLEQDPVSAALVQLASSSE